MQYLEARTEGLGKLMKTSVTCDQLRVLGVVVTRKKDPTRTEKV